MNRSRLTVRGMLRAAWRNPNNAVVIDAIHVLFLTMFLFLLVGSIVAAMFVLAASAMPQ